MTEPPKRDWLNLYKTKDWWRLRYYQLKKSPICKFCEELGYFTEATVVDHIKPHKGNRTLFYDKDNLQSLCKKHHDSAKQKEEKRGVPIGCDENGIVGEWK